MNDRGYAQITSLFESLERPQKVSDLQLVFRADVLGPDFLLLAKDPEGRPTLLVCDPTAAQANEAPLRMMNLNIEWCKELCWEASDGTTHDGKFTTLECVSERGDIQEMFLRMVPTILESGNINSNIINFAPTFL
jgi:hypothetical protein